MTTHTTQTSPRLRARVAGLLYLLQFPAAIFGTLLLLKARFHPGWYAFGA